MAKIYHKEDGTMEVRSDGCYFKPRALSCSAPATGSVSGVEDIDEWKLEEGFWVKSKTTGRLFAPGFIPTSDIDCVLIDGEWFDRK